ncbi:MAG: outer membrane protein assembly factor BamA [Acidobacteriota bacterium]
MSKRVLCSILLLLATIALLPVKGQLALSKATVLAGKSQEVLVEQVVIRQNRRIPESTIKIWIGTREGEPFNPAQITRDIRALYAQGHFDDVKVYSEDGSRGGKIITFEVKEFPLLLDIKYEGLKSVQQSTILEEFRKRQVGLSKEAQYDPVKAKRAAAVIKELLANEGRPEAKVEPILEDISATAVGLTFKIEEGPRFRVAEIEFEGNKVFSDSHLRKKMKLVKEVGLFTTFTSKDIYHKEKLENDLQRLRALVYADNGYLRVNFGEPRVEQVGRVGSWVPIFGHKGEGLKIVIPVDEGKQYRAGEIKVEDNTEFTEQQIKDILGIKPGDVVKGYSVIQKGMDNLKKVYGTRGYIQFSANPQIDYKDDPSDPTKGIADITFQVEEGKQYTLRRLEFIGNTFTRDNVLRREVLLNEGDRYNQQLWDLSLLRLNQLGYFDQVKEEDATINTNEREGQVDMTLKVQEKGRQQISFTGGVSGIGGSFIGIDYSTNNLLGYGESLSFSIAAGNRQKIFSIGFTEPYLKGRPISLGFNLFYQDYQFFGSGFSLLTVGNNLQTFDEASLFTQRTAGISVSASAPLQYFMPRARNKGRFIRLGLSYAFRVTDILDPANNRDSNEENDSRLTFRQSNVTQSTLTASAVYNTLNSSLDPTNGQSITFAVSLSGGVLGGKVNTIQPTLEYKFFRPLFAGREATERPDPSKTRTFGMRFLAGHISSYGKPFESNSFSFVGGTPLFGRYFLGGEETIRGYGIRGIAPTANVSTVTTARNPFAVDSFSLKRLKVRPPRRATNNSIAPSVLEDFVFTDREDPRRFPDFPTFIGGDTQLLLNFEYRIPVVGPLQLVPFFDVGSVFNLRNYADQLIISERLSDTPLSALTLNPRGLRATRRELREARTPETPPGSLPPGFRFATILADQQIKQKIELADTVSNIFDNYRYSTGAEIRVQVPVINVPFRLIFALNPNARTDSRFFFEDKRTIRFSVGRTF